MKMIEPTRVLALAAIALAGVASMADAPEPMHWEVAATVAGPTLTLGAASADSIRKTEHVTGTLHEGGGSSDFSRARVTFDATACVSPAAAGARLRIVALPDSTAYSYGTGGEVAEFAVPTCPATVTLNAEASMDSSATTCATANPCTLGFSVEFERIGDTGGDMQVTWDANGIALGYSSKQPPPGTTFTLVVDP